MIPALALQLPAGEQARPLVASSAAFEPVLGNVGDEHQEQMSCGSSGCVQQATPASGPGLYTPAALAEASPVAPSSVASLAAALPVFARNRLASAVTSPPMEVSSLASSPLLQPSPLAGMPALPPSRVDAAASVARAGSAIDCDIDASAILRVDASAAELLTDEAVHDATAFIGGRKRSRPEFEAGQAAGAGAVAAPQISTSSAGAVDVSAAASGHGRWPPKHQAPAALDEATTLLVGSE